MAPNQRACGLINADPTSDGGTTFMWRARITGHLPSPHRTTCDVPHKRGTCSGDKHESAANAFCATCVCWTRKMLARTLVYLYFVLLGFVLILDKPAQLAIGY